MSRGAPGQGETVAIAVLRACAALAAVVLFIAATTTDADIWGHVHFGEDILDDRMIASHDPYSFTSDRSWINHEWLAEVLMALSYRAGGGAGLVVLKVAVVVGTLVIVARALGRVPWRTSDHDALMGLALLATSLRTTYVRPQIFSVLIFAGLLLALISADRGRPRALFAVPPLMLLWTNLHGGWLVGLGVLTIWIGVRLLGHNPAGLARRALLLTWGAAVAATLVNPYGTGLWSFLRETVGLERPGIADWQPLLQLPPLFAALAGIVAAIGVAALIKAGRRADPAYALIALALSVATLRVGRIDAFLALSVVMLLGPYLGRTRAATADTFPSLGLLRNRPAALAAVVAVAVGLIVAGGARATCISLDGEPEPDAVSFFERHGSEARVLTYFDWGQYAIWHLAPAVTVSMDGRRETVYSDGLFLAHARLYTNKPDGTAIATRLVPDFIWLPTRLAVVRRLRQEGWTLAFKGQESVILARNWGGPPVIVRGPAPRDRCFPQA